MASQKWFLQVGDREKGPYDTASLERSLKDGTVKPSTLARAVDSDEWLPLHAVVTPKLSEPPSDGGRRRRAERRATRELATRNRVELIAGAVLCAGGTLRLLLISEDPFFSFSTRTLVTLGMIGIGAVLVLRASVRR